MAENHAGFGLLVGLEYGLAELRHDSIVDGIALVGTVQTNQRDIALEFVGDQLLVGHSNLSPRAIQPVLPRVRLPELNTTTFS